MCLEDEIDKLFEAYPNYFNKQSKTSFRAIAKTERKIDYKNLSYKVLFPNDEFHEISFLKKYGTLYRLLEGLVTRKTTVNLANVDQTSFIINLMHGYNDWDCDKKWI